MSGVGGGRFGELALLTTAPRAATVRAAGVVKLLKLGYAAFEKYVGGCAEVCSCLPTSCSVLGCNLLFVVVRCRSLSFLFLFAQRPCCAKVLSARAELYAEQQRSIARKISDFDKEVRDPPEPHTSISDRVRVRCTGRCVPSSLVFRGTNVGRGGQGQVRRKDALPRAQTR